MQEIIQQLGALLLGSVPTILLFILLVLAYQFLVQGPMAAMLKERRARTEGAQESAHQAIARAETRAVEYAGQLRQTRAEAYKTRELRVKQWHAERDATLDAVRKAAEVKVRQAKTEMEVETVKAKQAIQASAPDLSHQVSRAVLPVAAGGSR
jgi:F-type H+-transporting ATPase subunit b